MQLLQPILLWGLLGISIPFLIHLWRGKKGKVMSWAAMHWLPTQESSVANGIRLENILVLLLRILMLLLLVVLLSQVFVPKLSKVSEERIIHLVQPSNLITEEYKFEIQQALEKGEDVYWADEAITPIESIEDLMIREKNLNLQASLDKVPSEATELNLYLSNSENKFGSAFFLSKVKPKLYLGSADFVASQPQTVSLDGGKILVINEQGLLDSLPKGQQATATKELGKEQFGYFLNELSSSERTFIQAALEAINDVYGFDFIEKESEEEAKLIFASELSFGEDKDKLYFISDTFSFSEQSNLITFSDQLDFEESELVKTGQLPEVILEAFLSFSGVEQQDVRLSQAQFERRFLVGWINSEEKKANLDLLLLGLLLLCFAAERYFANEQGI
jgi:hypothetical protein